MTTAVMTWDDVAELLAFCAVFDNRKGGKLDIEAWLGVATDQRWPADVVRRIAREHYGSGRDRPRLDPATVTDRLRDLRGKAAESFDAPPIPDGLPNREYPAWLRAQLAEHCDALLERWAATGDEPSRSLPVEPQQLRTVEQLAGAAPAELQPGLRSAWERIKARRPRLDPDRREHALRELRELEARGKGRAS